MTTAIRTLTTPAIAVAAMPAIALSGMIEHPTGITHAALIAYYWATLGFTAARLCALIAPARTKDLDGGGWWERGPTAVEQSERSGRTEDGRRRASMARVVGLVHPCHEVLDGELAPFQRRLDGLGPAGP